MNKFKDILDKVGKDILSEETKIAITTAFDGSVNELVKERVQLEVTNALQTLDEQHSSKLQKLLETIDNDHSKKLTDVVKKIDENHSAKLREIVRKYETMLKEEAVSFKDYMTAEVNNYLELYLDKTIPKAQITEAVENTRSRKFVEKLRKILAVEDEFVTKTIAESVGDGKKTIDTLRRDLNEAMKENIKINQDLRKVNAEMVLERKTSGMPDKKRGYVRRMLGEKAPEEIEKNFDYVVEMFEREEKEQISTASEKARQTAVSKTSDVPKSVITETVNDSADVTQKGEPVNEYLKELERFDKNRK